MLSRRMSALDRCRSRSDAASTAEPFPGSGYDALEFLERVTTGGVDGLSVLATTWALHLGRMRLKLRCEQSQSFWLQVLPILLRFPFRLTTTTPEPPSTAPDPPPLISALAANAVSLQELRQEAAQPQ